MFDVSEYNNPDKIPFVECDGMIARVTKRGNKIDEKFYTFYNISEQANKPFGAYKYSYANNANDAHLEAVAVCQILRGCAIELGFWLDLESEYHRVASDSLIKSIIEQYMTDFDAYGIKFSGIYCDYDFYRKHIALLKTYPIWLARWTHNPNTGIPVGSNFVAWQYTNRYDKLHLDASLWNLNKKDKPDKTEVIPYNPDNVRLLQNYLNKYYGYNLNIDGVMGKNTFTAICQTIAK